MIQDERDLVQKAQSLDIVEKCSFPEAGALLDLRVSRDLSKLKDLCLAPALVADGRLLERFDAPYGESGLFHRLVNVAHSFPVQRLYITVGCQF